jgi:peptidoglycan/LPS O-acetylase OafA/YrhL
MLSSAAVTRIKSSLSRVTTTGRFIPEIDGLRFVAIASVVIYHLNLFYLPHSKLHADWVSTLAGKGNYGVQLFFTISGFILGLPFAASRMGKSRRISLKKYFLRRLTRLEPPYILNLILIYVVDILRRTMSASLFWPNLVASMFYLHNLTYAHESLINTAAWSLEIEVQFYLLVPALSFLFAIKGKVPRRLTMVAMMLGFGLFQALIHHPSRRLELSILFYLQYFLAGFLFADIFLVDCQEKPIKNWYWDVVCLLAAPLIYLCTTYGVAARLLFPFATLAFYCGVMRSKVFNRIFTRAPVTIVGGMCYTIYLYHASILTILGRATFWMRIGNIYWISFMLQLLLLGTAVVAISGVLFVLVERPCMKPEWHKSLWSYVFAKKPLQEKEAATNQKPG